MSTKFDQTFRRSSMTPVRLCPIAEFFGTYDNGARNGIGATFKIPNVTIDNQVLNLNDRILFYNQATYPYQNGIYVVTDIQTDTITLTRAYDFQTSDQMAPGNFCTIYGGTNNKGKIITVVEPQPQRIGVDAINFKLA